MHSLGEFISTFANAWDAADAVKTSKAKIINCCSRNPVYLGTVWASNVFLNSVKGCVFQYMPDDEEHNPIKGNGLKILCVPINTKAFDIHITTGNVTIDSEFTYIF